MHVNGRRSYNPLKEIQRLGQVARTWRRNLPDEKRPDWELAKLKLIHKYLREPKRRVPEPPLRIHNGLYNEHAAREARLIDRTLRNGTMHADLTHSFRDDRVKLPTVRARPNVPEANVFVHTLHNEDHHEISHITDSGVPHVQAAQDRHINVATLTKA